MNGRSLWQRTAEIFSFPLRGAGSVGLAMLAIFSVVVKFIGPVGWVIATGIFFSFLFNLIRHTSQGKRGFPEVGEYLDFWDNILTPLMRGIAAQLIILVPTIIYVVKFKDFGSVMRGQLGSFLFDPIMILFLLLGFAYFPMAFCLAAINENLGHVLNPLIGLNLIRRAWAAYANLLGFLLGFIVIALGISFLLSITVFQVRIIFVTTALREFFSYYLATAFAYTLGIWTFQHREELGYDIAEPTDRALAYGAWNPHAAETQPQSWQSVTRLAVAPIDDELQAARSLYEEGKLAESKSMFDDLARRFPEDVRPKMELYEIAKRNQDFSRLGIAAGSILEWSLLNDDMPRAATLYREIVQQGPGVAIPVDVLLKIAQEFQRQHMPIEALRAYLHLGFLYPTDPRAVRALVSAADLYTDHLRLPKKGAELFRLLQNCFPNSSLTDRIRSSLRRADKLAFK